jgi:heme-degrading monooxygenase HmoA
MNKQNSYKEFEELITLSVWRSQEFTKNIDNIASGRYLSRKRKKYEDQKREHDITAPQNQSY